MNFSVGKRRTQHMCWVGLLPHPRGIENIHGIVALPWCLLKTRCFDSKKNSFVRLNKARKTFLFVNSFLSTVKKSRLFLCFVGVTYILKFLSNPKLLTPPRKKETLTPSKWILVGPLSEWALIIVDEIHLSCWNSCSLQGNEGWLRSHL